MSSGAGRRETVERTTWPRRRGGPASASRVTKSDSSRQTFSRRVDVRIHPGRRFQPAYFPFSRRPLWERALAMVERRVKGALFGCRMCGNCLLQETAFICPMECPKGLRNGPCGGSTPEGCYVDPDAAVHLAPHLRAGRTARHDAQAARGAAAARLVARRAARRGPRWRRRRASGASARRCGASSGPPRSGTRSGIRSSARSASRCGGEATTSRTRPRRTSRCPRSRRSCSPGTFVVTSEVAPPLAVAPDELTRTLNILRDYIDAANFTDNPSATPRMSSLACSALAIQQGVEPVMQIAARDRTRMGLQAEILGAAALGVRNVLCLTGDHSRLGPAPHGRMDIWDLDSIQMLWILRRMRDAKIWLDGRGIAHAAAPVPRRRRVAVRLHARHAGAARAEEVERGRAVLPEQPGLRRGRVRAVPRGARQDRRARAHAVPRRHHAHPQRARGADDDAGARDPDSRGADRPPRAVVRTRRRKASRSRSRSSSACGGSRASAASTSWRSAGS